jgi:hypothetical protein
MEGEQRSTTGNAMSTMATGVGVVMDDVVVERVMSKYLSK